jgi:uncharacterized cupin superfamily protein
MTKYVIKKSEIEEMEGLFKQHFLNPDAQRTNKSLGDLTGINGFGFHIIEVQPGKESTEYHVHYYEDECVYILSGKAMVTIGEEQVEVTAGDFIGYRAGGLAHTMINHGNETLKCVVVGQRLDHDVGDYPRKNKRIYRNTGQPWDLVDLDKLDHPDAGKKK